MKIAGLRLFQHAREREIARNVARANRGPLTGQALERLWKDLLQQTRAAVRRALHLENSGRKRH
jgi:chorismate mutase